MGVYRRGGVRVGGGDSVQRFSFLFFFFGSRMFICKDVAGDVCVACDGFIKERGRLIKRWEGACKYGLEHGGDWGPAGRGVLYVS